MASEVTMHSIFLDEPDVHEWTEERRMYGSDHPISFSRYLDIAGAKDFVELVNGILVEKMAAQLDHEWSIAWLYHVLGVVAGKLQLGMVLGSRTPVEISEFGGRLPDILFVSEARRDIVQQKAVYGAPDLVIEFRSPGDRPSDIIALETDYRRIGVFEIAFVDRRNGTIRLLRKRDPGYEETIVSTGPFVFETLPEIRLEAAWLLTDARPEAFDFITEAVARVQQKD